MLCFLLIAFVPLSVFEFVLRASDRPPPHWLGDALAFALLALAAFFLIGAWERRKRESSPQASLPTREWEASLPCLLHEIRNYSSIIKGNAALLRTRMDGPDILEPLGRLERTTEKIGDLAQEILDAASPTEPGDRKSICLRALVENCIAEHFQEVRCAFRIEATGDVPAISGDERKLERVFLNLFRNSREAGANLVRIRMQAAFGRMRVWVEDDGTGCAQGEVTRLFEARFSTKKAKGGSGLGLFMVKAILEAHGGAITALSKNDPALRESGMVFRLEFPLGAGRPAGAPVLGNTVSPLEETLG